MYSQNIRTLFLFINIVNTISKSIASESTEHNELYTKWEHTFPFTNYSIINGKFRETKILQSGSLMDALFINTIQLLMLFVSANESK